jgi:hypothetical protein
MRNRLKFLPVFFCLVSISSSHAFNCLIEPNQTVDLGAPVTGLLDQVLVNRADRIVKGQILARLESRAEMAAMELARFKSVVRIGGASQLLAPAEGNSINEGNEMLFMDMILPPDHGNSPILLAQADSKLAEVDNTVWVAQDVEQNGGTFDYVGGELAQGRILGPQGVDYILRSSGWLKKQGITSDNPKISVIIETLPGHGKIERIESGEAAGLFRYTPDADFLG